MSTKVRVSKKAPKAKAKASKPAKRKQAAREPGKTTITAKNQVTIPVSVLKATGLKPGDRVEITADLGGKIRVQRDETPMEALDRISGSLRGMWYEGYLDDVRSGRPIR